MVLYTYPVTPDGKPVMDWVEFTESHYVPTYQ